MRFLLDEQRLRSVAHGIGVGCSEVEAVGWRTMADFDVFRRARASNSINHFAKIKLLLGAAKSYTANSCGPANAGCERCSGSEAGPAQRPS